MKMFRLKVLLAVMILMAGMVVAQDFDAVNVPMVSRAVYFDTTPPLVEMPVVLPGERDRSWKDGIIQNRSIEDFRGRKSADPFEFDDPVHQQDYPTGRSTRGPVINMDGVGNLSSVYPPDTDGDVGPDHYFQMINLSFAIWDKSGNLLYGPVDNSTLWNGFIGPWTGTNDGDPIVLYDELADRWMASQFAVNTSNGTYWQLIAVSATPDPTGAYHRYAFQFPAFNDYPKLSVWPDAYYATFNMFGSYVRVGVAAFDRAAMLAGDPDAEMVYFNQPSGTFSMLPADFDGTPPPAGAPCYFAHLTGSGSSPVLEIYEFDVDWQTPANSSFSLVTNLSPASYSGNLNGIPQPGTNTRLDDLAMMIMYRLQYRNFGDYQTMVTNHSVNVGSGRAGIRWYELRKDSGPWYIYQQGTYAPNDGENRWMGSIAMNGNGDIALGYSRASSSTYPSIYYVGRRASSPLGVMDLDEIMITGGTNSQSGINRWGDYACMSVDPVDDSTFWFTTEYMRGGWKTRIASFDFGPILPPQVFAGNDTTVCETSYFLANQAEAFYQQSVQWFTSGDGMFSDPYKVQATYLRGPADVTAGEVTLWVVATGYIQGQSDSDTVQLYFSRKAKANAGPDTLICAGETVMMNGSATNYTHILWKTDGDGTFNYDTTFTPVYTPGPTDISKGYAWLSLVAYDTLPCTGSNTDKVKINIDQCTGTEEIIPGTFHLTVQPNPAYQQLQVQVGGLEASEDLWLTLTSTQGITLFSMKLGQVGGMYSNTMDVSRFPRGVYYFKASTQTRQAVSKVVLQ